MFESIGQKLFKPITETADDLGGRLEVEVKKLVEVVSTESETLVTEMVSLSVLLKLVLLILAVLLVFHIVRLTFVGLRYVFTLAYRRYRRGKGLPDGDVEAELPNFVLTVPVLIASTGPSPLVELAANHRWNVFYDKKAHDFVCSLLPEEPAESVTSICESIQHSVGGKSKSSVV
uniref:Uncharacterized protein n=1 Tax=Steinernema glaseri TaxID=37863 RepID=A0A1I8AJ78_9BILA